MSQYIGKPRPDPNVTHAALQGLGVLRGAEVAPAELFVIFDMKGPYGEPQCSEAAARATCDRYNRIAPEPLKPYSYRRYLAAADVARAFEIADAQMLVVLRSYGHKLADETGQPERYGFPTGYGRDGFVEAVDWLEQRGLVERYEGMGGKRVKVLQQ